jgi:hypothetical protein
MATQVTKQDVDVLDKLGFKRDNLYIPEVKMDSQENRIIQLEMPDLSSLSETERLQVIAVMQRAQVTLQSTVISNWYFQSPVNLTLLCLLLIRVIYLRILFI